MEMENLNDGNSGKHPAEKHGSTASSGFENIKNIVADKLHSAAGTLSDKTASQDMDPNIASYGNQASEWLDQSAKFVREFDFNDADARIREYVRESPGHSILIAGAVGLIVGAILRRR
jgi:hypothetical protein